MSSKFVSSKKGLALSPLRPEGKRVASDAPLAHSQRARLSTQWGTSLPTFSLHEAHCRKTDRDSLFSRIRVARIYLLAFVRDLMLSLDDRGVMHLNIIISCKLSGIDLLPHHSGEVSTSSSIQRWGKRNGRTLRECVKDEEWVVVYWCFCYDTGKVRWGVMMIDWWGGGRWWY